MHRRRYLRLLATGGAGALAGCGALSEGGEGSEVEIIPNNRTDRTITATVRVYARDGDRLMEDTYTLEPDHLDESRGVPNRVGYLLVSVDGRTVRERYEPVQEADCPQDGEDVGIAFTPDGIEFFYTC